MASTGKKILIGAGGVVGLVIVAALVAPSFIDVNDYKPQIIAAAKQATGRQLAIDGRISLSLLPLPSVSVAGVSFANMPGAKSPQMVEIKSVTVKPALMPLLSGNVEIVSITIVEPRISVEVNAQGKASWDFAPVSAPSGAPAGAPARPPAGKAAPDAKSGPAPAFSLNRVTVENGTLSYTDAKSGQAIAVEKLNLTASLSSLGNAPSNVLAGKPAPAGAPAGGAGMPIDTSPLRAYDGTLSLTAASVTSAPHRLANVDLAGALKGGVLTLQRLKFGVYGGSVDLTGTVNGSQPALAFDMKGDVSNILVGEMLRQTSGSNQFGSTVKVTIDGKLSARDIAVKGAGTTSQQIQSSIAGSAQLGGHIFVGADKTLTAVGGAVTGAAGGAIDSTLGSALGAAGQRGGVGVANLLNAISLVLNRFVNNDNPISGGVDIANGVLSDKGLVVRGNKASANITTRTNLAASTTDTTINFMIAEDASAPYLITTLKGPLSKLAYNVTRGTAKDPPGMPNTLGNAVTTPATNPVQNVLPGGGGGGGGGQPSNSPVPRVPNIFGR